MSALLRIRPPVAPRRARTLARVLAGALALAGAAAPSAGAYVYWAQVEANSVFRVAHAGGHPDYLASGDRGACGVAVDATHVYWANLGAGTIGRVGRDGGGPTASFLTVGGRPCGVAVAGGHVYWADESRGIGRARLDGSGVTMPFIAASGPRSLAGNATHLYWPAANGAIGRAALDGSELNGAFFASAGALAAVGLSDTHVYWPSSANGGSVIRGPLAGGARAEVLRDLPGVCGVSADSEYVYWGARDTQHLPARAGRIGRARLDGSERQPDFLSAFDPCAIAVDKPRATTGAVTDVGPASATLHGTVAASGQEASGSFVYGADPAALAATTAAQPVGAGDADVAFAASVAGLAPGTTYYYRAAGTGPGGTALGALESFTTPAAPDSEPPRVRLRAVRTTLASARRHGIPVRAGCSEACTQTITVTIDRRTARRYGIRARRRSVPIARLRVELAGDAEQALRVPLTRLARARLRRARGVRIVVTAAATDAAGNRAVLRRRASLR